MSSGTRSGKFQSKSIPLWWERQLGATGITYPDPDLKDRVVVAGGGDFELGRTDRAAQPVPLNFSPSFGGNFNHHTNQTDRPEIHVLAYEDRRPISNVDMFCSMQNTQRNGFYLSKP